MALLLFFLLHCLLQTDTQNVRENYKQVLYEDILKKEYLDKLQYQELKTVKKKSDLSSLNDTEDVIKLPEAADNNSNIIQITAKDKDID